MTMRGLLIFLLALAASPASAQISPAVVQAKAAGVVGERFDGYLGLVSNAPDSLRRQVAQINIRRRALYSSLAQRKGVTTEEVGITAGCSTLRRVGVGEYYFIAQGGWQRRAAGQAPPVPAYCG
jgi:uncharacterized protein YdbL (DUF1318 family)